jgi:opacity protein-like surface antigen
MKRFLAAAIALAALSSAAASACTTDELQAKAMAVSTKISEMAQKDPQKASAWSQKFAAQQQGATQPKSMDETCKMYDDLLASLN